MRTAGQVAAMFRPAGSTGPGVARLWQAGRFTTITRTHARLQALIADRRLDDDVFAIEDEVERARVAVGEVLRADLRDIGLAAVRGEALRAVGRQFAAAAVDQLEGATEEEGAIDAGDDAIDRHVRGGVEGITWNGEDADYVKFNVALGAWKLLGLGKLPLTSPKPLPPPPSDDRPLDKK